MDATPRPPYRPSGPHRPDRAFATGYRRHSGDLMVYGGGVLTLIGMLASLINGTPLALLASLVGTLSAFFYGPTIDPTKAQLGANAEGLYVARLGFVPWGAISDLEVERRALRTLRLATLVVTTCEPVRTAVAIADPVPLGERFTTSNMRVSGHTVRVQLHTLAMPADAIEQRLRALRTGA